MGKLTELDGFKVVITCLITMLILTALGVAAVFFASGSQLNFAIVTDQTMLVRKLINEGADVNATGIGKETSLHLAATVHANPAVATMLIEAGADPDAISDAGETPLQLAIKKKRSTAFINALQNTGAKE